jgi:copper chaperone
LSFSSGYWLGGCHALWLIVTSLLPLLLILVESLSTLDSPAQGREYPQSLPSSYSHDQVMTIRMHLTLTVPKLACAACVATVTQAIQTVDPQAEVSGDPGTKQVRVMTTVDPEQIYQALVQVGYPPV